MRFHRVSLLALALTAVIVLVAGPLSLTAQTTTAPSKYSAEISRLLKETMFYASQAESDAAELESYSQSDLSWESHAEQLERMRDDVNNMVVLVQRMNVLRSDGSSWQQDGIDQINPLLEEMVDRLTTTITEGNKHPELVRMMKFRNYVHACADTASQTHKLISDLVAYDRTRSREVVLEHNLGLHPATVP